MGRKYALHCKKYLCINYLTNIAPALAISNWNAWRFRGSFSLTFCLGRSTKEHRVPVNHLIPRPFSCRQNEERNQPVNHEGLGGNLSVDFGSLWDAQQRHCRRPSQRCVKFAISWRADQLPTGSRRYYNKERASSIRCHKKQAKAKLGRQYWRLNFHLFYLLEVSSLPIFVSSPKIIAYSDTRTGLN